MANKKKEYYKPKPMTEGKRNIIQGLLQEYNIESAADIQEALKDLLGGTIKEMMEAEMDEHLGYAMASVRKEADNRPYVRSEDTQNRGHLRCKRGCDQIYFDEINLMELLHKKRDKQVTGLIKKRLKAGVVGQGVITRTGEDSPQEDPQSLLLEKI